MTFEVIPPNPAHGRRPIEPGQVIVSTRPKPGRGKGRMLELRLGRRAAQAAGWRKGLAVSIAWGSGPDLGKLRIVPHKVPPFWVVRVNKAETVHILATGAIPEGHACQGGRQDCHHEILPKTGRDPGPVLIVRLPESVYRGREDDPEDGDPSPEFLAAEAVK